MSATTVLEVENLSKMYNLGVINYSTLSHEIQTWWSKRRGKDDPNRKIAAGPDGDSPDSKPMEESDRFWALDNVSLSVKQGEILGIIGINGAGKSTLLKIISRITAPTKGLVNIKGRLASLLEVGTGFHPELTGRENIYLNGTILGLSKSDIAKKFDEIIDFAEVNRFVDTPVKRYSSGMHVRLGFAVAAHLEPDILLVDEVLAVGDVQFQKKCFGKMSDVSQEGRTILFVSHNMNSIAHLCERAILLENGRLVYDDTSEKTVAHYLNLMADHIGVKDGYVSLENHPGRSNKHFDRSIELTHCELRDENGAKVNGFQTGKEARIRLGYKINIKPDRQKMTFLVSITNNSGKYLTQIWSEIVGKDFDTSGLKGEVECKIPRFPFIPGKYGLTLAVFVGSRKTDVVYNAVEINVVGGEFYKSKRLPSSDSFGEILLDYDWDDVS